MTQHGIDVYKRQMYTSVHTFFLFNIYKFDLILPWLIGNSNMIMHGKKENFVQPKTLLTGSWDQKNYVFFRIPLYVVLSKINIAESFFLFWKNYFFAFYKTNLLNVANIGPPTLISKFLCGPLKLRHGPPVVLSLIHI